MKKPLLIFDLDGTLIDSVPDLAVAVNDSLAKNALPTHSTDTIRAMVGNGAYVLCERAVKDGSSNELIHQVHQDFLAYYKEHTCNKSVAYDGVKDGLLALKSYGYTLALATNKPASFIPCILSHFGWDTLFDCIVGGDSLPAKKPDPAPLLHICKTLGFAPTQGVMIGDSKNDIIAGKKAKLSTIALTYGYNYDEPIADSKPDFVFDHFLQMVNSLLRDSSNSLPNGTSQ